MDFNTLYEAAVGDIKASFQSVATRGKAGEPVNLPAAQASAKTDFPVNDQCSLAMASVGDRIQVVAIQGGQKMTRRLTDMGIAPNVKGTVVSQAASGSTVLARDGCRLGLGAGMAHCILVKILRDYPMETSYIPLGELSVGDSGYVVGYEKGNRTYRKKLLSMGLTPGTHFTITHQAPMGDPVEIEVRGFKLSLRKGEAAALQVSPILPPDAKPTNAEENTEEHIEENRYG